MKLCVAGTGYVGLVTAACFADAGHEVVGLDTDEEKIAALRAGKTPIYEPELEDFLRRGRQSECIRFETDYDVGVRDAEAVFICVGTPTGPDGIPDLSAVFQSARSAAAAANGPVLIVLKSTVPVGTNDIVQREVSSLTDQPVEVASNPEFLKEGAAVEDFLRPDRVVIGVRSRRAAELLTQLYGPFVRTGAPIVETDPSSAEMGKYAANGMLACRISFINEIARLCDRFGADVDSVRRIVGSDRRIGSSFLFAGPGYGGSCFPKDVRGMTAMGAASDMDLPLIEAIEETNRQQRSYLFGAIREQFGGDLTGRRIAVWGLAFKPRTDDVRESPALDLVRFLLDAGAEVSAFDPTAMANAKAALGGLAGRVRWAHGRYDAAEDAEALVLVTEWTEFRRPETARLAKVMRGRIVFDWRNILDGEMLARGGFTVRGIGRPAKRPAGG